MREIKDPTAPDDSPVAPDTAGMVGVPPSAPAQGADAAAAGIASGIETPTQREDKAIQASMKGRVTDDIDDDPSLAMEGIINGDPVGMEAFDLGFFDDGTPAIRIGKGVIPVNQSMWMGLLTMRNKTRTEMDAMLEHQQKVDKTREQLRMAIKAMPKIPQQTQMVLEAMTAQYPDWVGQQIIRMGVNMDGDGGYTQSVELSAEYQNYLGGNWVKGKSSQRKKYVPLAERIAEGLAPDESEKVLPSVMDEATEQAMSMGDVSMAGAVQTAAWVAKYGAQHRLESARQGMPVAGLFDLCMVKDQNPQKVDCMLGQLMLAASNQTLNGSDSVPLPERIEDPTKAIPYLLKLQDWAARNWGYGPNSEVGINMAAEYVLWFSQNYRNASAPPAVQPAAPAAAPRAPQNQAPARPSAPPFTGQQRQGSGLSN